MSLARNLRRFRNRKRRNPFSSPFGRNTPHFELLEPRIVLTTDLIYAPAADAALDATLRLQNVAGVDTLQLIENSDQSVLASQDLADTSGVIITGSGDWDLLIVDFANPFSTPITFNDGSDTDSDTLSVINTTDRTWNLTGRNSGNVAGVQFEGIENFLGENLSDQFIFGDGWGAVAVINVGTDNDILDFSNVSADLTFFIYSCGTVAVTDGTNTLQETAGIATIKGGQGNNTFLFDDGGSFAGSIHGGTGGVNTLDYSAYTAGVTVDLMAETATGTTGVTGIQNVVGGRIADTLAGDAQANRLTGGGGNDTLSGGAGDDCYVLMPDSGTDTIVEYTGSDTLDYSAYATGVTIDLGAGTAPGITGVNGIENVIGGSGADTLTGSADANVLAGGPGDDVYVLEPRGDTDTIVEAPDAGSDTLDYSVFNAAVTVNLAAGTATGLTAGIANVENVIGGSGADSLSGDDGANVLTGGRGDDTLVGGAGDDTYILTSDTGTKTIVENPNEGSDTLDYSAFTKAVTVDLTTGTATGLTAGVANIENVIGGTGKDTIKGDSRDNVLTGGPGADILIGGGGIDIARETRDASFTLTNSTLVIGSEDTDLLTEIEAAHLIGGPGDNHFDVSGFTVGSVRLDGGGGNDTYDLGTVKGTVYIAQEGDLTIDSDILASEIVLIAGGTITVGPGVTISSRQISGENYLLSPSTGDSGAISFEAQTISIGSGARILSHVEDGSIYKPGNIALDAHEAAGFSGLLVLTADDSDTKVELQNATIKGGDITISARSDSARNFFDAATDPGTITTPDMFQDSGLDRGALDFLTSLSVFAGVAISNASAELLVGQGSVIEATNLTMFAGSQTEATITTITAVLGAAVGVTNSDAKITVENGARITTENDLSITSFAGDEMAVEAMQHYALPSDGPEKVNLCLAIGVSDVESTAQIASGATVEAGGDLSVEALMDRNIKISASAVSYEDGTFGSGIAFSYADADATAAIDGTARATGSVQIRADSQTEKDDVSAKSGVGTGAFSGFILGLEKWFVGKTPAAGIDTYYRKIIPALDSWSNSTTPLALSAAFSYTDQSTDATARVGEFAVVSSLTGDVDVHASIVLVPETSATSTIDSQVLGTKGPAGNTKDNSFSAAVVLGAFHNTANAYIAAHAVVDAGQNVAVQADNLNPYDIQWFQLESFSDITDKMNSNFGFQNGVFTSWAQSNAQGADTSIAGTANFFTMDDETNAYIDEYAKVNHNRRFSPSTAVAPDADTIAFDSDHHFISGQEVVYDDGGGQSVGNLTEGGHYYVIVVDDRTVKLAATRANALAAIPIPIDLNLTGTSGTLHTLSGAAGDVIVQAKTQVDAVHMSGVFGVWFFGSQGGKGGVGGSYLQVTYDNDTNALIKRGAEVAGDTLTVHAATTTRDISIAESGGAADKFGVNGSVSLVTTDNNTLAQIDDGATVTTGDGAVRLPKDIHDWMGDDNFKLLEPIGVTWDPDWLTERVPLVLDSNLDGVVDANDDGVDYVDSGADADSPWDDTYVLNENQFIAAEDQSQIFNLGGGIVKGQSVGIGASVAINEINRDTRALVGTREQRVSQQDFSPAAGIDSTDAVHLGYSHGYTDGDAVLYTSGDGMPIGGLATGGRYYVDSLDGTTVRLARSAAEAMHAPSTYFTPAAVNGATGAETIDLGYTHGFQLGDAVVYHNGGGTSIGGLVDGQTYYVIPVDSTTIALARSVDEAFAESRNLFQAQDAVDAADDAIDFGSQHELTTGQAVVYRNGGGTSLGGLTNGTAYYVVVQDETVIKLAATYANAVATTPVTLDLSLPEFADGSLHSLHPAFNPVSAVDSGEDTIDLGYEHGFVTGDPIIYSPNGGSSIGGLTGGAKYYVVVVNAETIALANSEAAAANAKPRLFSAASDVNSTDDTINLLFHGFQTGDAVVYENETGTDIGGLTNGAAYYILRVDENTVRLAPTLDDAQNGTHLINLDARAAFGAHWLRGNTRIDLTATSATGSSHTIRPDLRVDLNSAAATGTAHSFTLALDPSSATGVVHAIGRVFNPATSVNVATDAVNLGYTHGFTTGQAVAYSCGGGTPIGGIGEGQTYYAVVVDATTIKLAASEADAKAGKVIDLDSSEAEGPLHAIGAVIPSSPAVDGTTDTINFGGHHGYTTGQPLVYHTGGGQAVGGLVDGQTYYAVVLNDTAIQLAPTEGAAKADIPTVIDLDPSTATGAGHTFSDPDDLTGSVSSGSDIAVLALNDGQIINATLAASIVTDHATGQSRSGAVRPYFQGKYGVAVSGDVSVNIISDETEASIRDAAVAMASDLDVTARTADDIYAGAGSVSISWKDKNSEGIAGAFVNNILDNTTSASIDRSTVNITEVLNVAALTMGDIIGIAAGGSGSPKGVGIAGSVSVNVIDQDTFGYVQESDITSAHDVALAATSSSEITGVAGALTFGGKAGVGLSVSVDVITNATKAYVETSDIHAAGGISVTADSGAEGQNTPAIFDPAAGVDGAMNLITLSAPSRLGYGEEVSYDNRGGQSIGGLTDGATYYAIVLDDDTIALTASSDDADRAQKQFDTLLDVDDSSNSIYLGPDHGLATGDAVYYRNAADYQDEGSSPNGDIGLTHGTFYYAIVEGDWIKLATTKANALAGAAIALHPYYNQNPDDPDAKIGVRQAFLIQKKFVDLAPSSGTGDKQSLQVRSHDILGTAAALAVSVDPKARMAGAASVTVNTITNDTYAGISGKKVQGLVSGADVVVSATDSTEIIAVAGAVDIVSAWGKKVGGLGGFGASVAYNTIQGPVKAAIADATVESAGKVDLTALSDGSIWSLAVAGSGSVALGEGAWLAMSGVGAGSRNTVTNATEAEVVGSSVSMINGGALTSTARDKTSITANAYGGSFAMSSWSTIGFAVPIGVSVAINEIDNTVRAALENSTLGQIGDLTLTATADGSIDAVSVAAALSWESSQTSVAVSGGGAEATNYIGADVAAYVNHSDVPGADNVTIAATDRATVNATIVAAAAAGNISETGGWTAGIGGSVARNLVGWSSDTSTPYQWSTDEGLAQGQTLSTGDCVRIDSGARAGDVYEYLGEARTQPTAKYTATNTAQTVDLLNGDIVRIAPDFAGDAAAGSLYKYVGNGGRIDLASAEYSPAPTFDTTDGTQTLEKGDIVAIDASFEDKQDLSGSLYRYVGTTRSIDLGKENYLSKDWENANLWEEVRIDLRAEDYSDAELWKQVNLAKAPARVQAYTQDSAITASGILTITAQAEEAIDAVVAAAAVALSGGGRSGVGVSGAGIYAENRIASDIDAYIDGDGATGVLAGAITLTAGDASGIDAVAGAGALAGGFGGTAGVAIPIGVSVAINEIDNDVQAFIRNADTGVETITGPLAINASSTGRLAFEMDFAGRVTVENLDDAATQDEDDPDTSADEAAADAADDNAILEALRTAFTDHGVPLSGTLSLTTLAAGSRWLLVNEYGDTYVLEDVLGRLHVSGTSISAVSTAASLAATFGSTAGVSVSGAGAGSGNTIESDTRAFIENSRTVSSAEVALDAASTMTIASTVVAASLSLGIGSAGVGASIGVASAHNRVGWEGNGTVEAYLFNSTVDATGDLTLHAHGDQDISSTVAAGSGAIALGATGAGGLGSSIAVAKNEIGTDVKAFIEGDGDGIMAGGIALSASDTSTISAVAIAPSLSAVLGLSVTGWSVAIGAGVAHNTIAGTVASYVTGAVDGIESTLGNIVLTATGNPSISALAVAPSLSAGGGMAGVALGGGGAEARNVILTDVGAYINGSNVSSAADVSLLAEETAVIDARIAGANASVAGGLYAFGVSIGTATADNLIGYDKDETRSPAQVRAWIDGSDVNARDISVRATANSTVDALLVATSAAVTGGFSDIAASGAGVGLDNKVAMQVNAYIQGEFSSDSNGVDARGNVTVSAEDSSTITATGWAVTLAASAGAYSASVAVGVAEVHNLITSDVGAWVTGTTVSAPDGNLSVLASEHTTIDASARAAAVAAAFSIGTSPSGGGGKASSTVQTTTKAFVESSTVTLGGDLTVASEATINASAEMGADSESLALIAIAATGAVSTVTVAPVVEAWVTGSSVGAKNINISAKATPFGSATSRSLTVSTGGSVGVSKATTKVSPQVTAQIGGDITADLLNVVAQQALPTGETETANAEAEGALGGLLIGVDSSFSTASGNAKVTSGVSDGTHLQIADLATIIAESQSLQVAESKNAFGGLLAAGAAKSKATSGGDEGTTHAYLGAGVVFTGGDLAVKASGVDTNSATSKAGSGGLASGNAAIVSTEDQSRVTTNVGDGTTVVGGEVTITADHTSGYAVHADSVNGAVVGGNGAVADAVLSPTVLVEMGRAVKIDATGAVLVSALNESVKTSDDVNAQAGAGGVVSGSAATSDTNVTGTSSVTFGDAVAIDSGTDPVGNPGNITIVASSFLASFDRAENQTGGGITGAGSDVDLTAMLTNSVDLGTNGSFTSAGNVGVGTYTTTLTETDGEVNTWGVAGVGVAKATTHITTTQTVAVGAGTQIDAFGNVNLTAGEHPAGSYETSLTPTSIAQAYVKELIAIPHASATSALNSHASLDIASGAVIRSGQNVTIGAFPGTLNPVAEGRGYGYEVGFIPVTWDDSSVSSSTSADVTHNGTITAGIYHDLAITIPDSGDTGMFSSQLTSSGEAPFTWEFDPDFRPHAYIAEHLPAQEQILDSGTTSDPVGAMTLGTLYASGGTVAINADAISGNGTVTAYGGPTITVTNNSPDYLIVGAVKIPNTPGGMVLFTGEAEADSLTIQEIGKDQTPTVTIINSYDGPVGTFPAGASTYGPAIFLMGAIENLGGLVAITNVSGSLGQTETIYGEQEIITVPQGVYVVDFAGNQPWYAGGNPYSQWSNYMIWPGGNPASGRPNAKAAVAYVVNAIYNPTSAYTTAYDLTRYLIGFAGDAPPDNRSFDYFGDGVPWTSVTANDSSKATAISRSLIGQAYKISNSADNTYGWFAMVPVEPLNRIALDYDMADLSGSDLSAIGGKEISINAMYLDINAKITAGQATDRSIWLPADLKVPVGRLPLIGVKFVDLPTYRIYYLNGLAPRTVDLPVAPVKPTDSKISATYDAETNQITINDVRASSAGGSVAIHGGILSTDLLGNIHVNGGLGKVVVDNDTGIPLVVQEVFGGTASMLSETISTVEITDTLKDPTTNHWLYVYQPGQGISVFNGAATDTLGDGTPESRIDGTSATYNPKADLRWQWQETASLTRNTEPGWPPEEWTWNFPDGQPNDPWQYVDPAGGVSNTPKGHLITQPGLAVFQQTITGWSDSGKTYNVHYHSSHPENTYFNYGFRKTNPPDNPPDPDGDTQWYALWVYHYPYNAGLTMTMSVKADNPILIDFSGPAEGLVSVTSNAAVILAGDIINPDGDVSIQATGSITETSSATLLAHDLFLEATEGIGSETSPFSAALTTDGALSVQGGSAGVFLDLSSGARIETVSSQTGTNYGDIVVRADDDLVVGPTPLASGAAHISGLNITLENTGGEIGTSSAPLVLSAHPTVLPDGSTRDGIVYVAALDDIGIRQRGGDLLAGAIKSQTGDVFIGVESGDLYDASGQTALQGLDEAQTAAVWSRLHLTSSYGAEEHAKLSVTAFEQLAESNYQEYWHLQQNGSLTDDVYTLRESSVELYRSRAAAALDVGDPTDEQVRAFAAHLYAAVLAFFDNVSLPADTSLGLAAIPAPLPADLGPVIADWRNQTDFQIFNASFGFNASDAQATELTKNSVWTEGELRYDVHRSALNAAGVSEGTGIPNVIGRNVTLDVSGTIGCLADPVEIALADMKSGSLSDEQAVALALATAPGSVTVVGMANSSGAKVELPFDTYVSQQDDVTLTGVKVARTQAFFVSASGTFTPRAGDAAFIKGTGTDLSISSVSVAGDLSLDIPGNAHIDHAGIQVSGSLTVTASGDISVSGSSVTAGAGVAFNAGKALTIDASSVTATTGSMFLVSGSTVSVSGSASFAGTDITVTAADDIDFDSSSTATSGGTVTIQGDSGNADQGVGSVINLAGAISADRVEILGESDGDTITIGGSVVSTHVSVDAAAGADTINLQRITAATMVRAGTEDDIINVGTRSPSSGGTMNGVTAPLTVDGDTGSDTLNVDDTGDSLASTGTLTNTTLSGLGMAAGITYAGLESLNISLGSGANTFTIGTTHTGTTTVNGNAGSDTITLNANAGHTILNTYAGLDSIHVLTVSAAATINAGSDNDFISVSNKGYVSKIDAPLTVNGELGFDTLTVDDSGDSLAKTGTLTNTTLTGLEMAAGITYAGLEVLNISLGFGADLFTIASTHAGTTTVHENGGNNTITLAANAGPVALYGGTGSDIFNIRTINADVTVSASAGNDLINVGSQSPGANGTLNGISAYLTVMGGTGVDTLNVDDTGDTLANVGYLEATTVTGLGMSAGISYKDLEALNISLGSGADTFTIISTHLPPTTLNGNGGNDNLILKGNAGPTTINAGAGADSVRVLTLSAPATINAGTEDDSIIVGRDSSQLAGTLNAIAEALTVDGAGGSDTLYLDDGLDTIANTGSLTSTTVTGLGMGRGITYGTMEVLKINLGSGGDTFAILSTHAGVTALYTNAGNDTITAPTNNPNLYIETGPGTDTINGVVGGGLLGAIHQEIFRVENGVWTVVSGRYEFAPETPSGDALGLFHIARDIPTYFEVTATIRAEKPTGGLKANAYLLFDYQNATDFKFAGLNVSTNKLQIGYRDATGWHVLVQRPYQGSLKSDTDYDVLLSINGGTATLIVEDRVTLTHAFPTPVDEDGVFHFLNGGMVGLGAHDAMGQITSVMGHVPRVISSMREPFRPPLRPEWDNVDSLMEKFAKRGSLLAQKTRTLYSPDYRQAHRSYEDAGNFEWYDADAEEAFDRALEELFSASEIA